MSDDMDIFDLDTITLCDDEGNEVEFDFLDLIPYKNESYAVLFPTEDIGNDGQVVILKVEESADDAAYIGIDDEKIIDAVFEIFKEKHKDELDFED